MRFLFIPSLFVMTALSIPSAANAGCMLDITIQNGTGQKIAIARNIASSLDGRVRVRGGGWRRIWQYNITPPKNIRKGRSYRFSYQAQLDCNKLRQFRFGYGCANGTEQKKYFPAAGQYYRRNSTRFHFVFRPRAC